MHAAARTVLTRPELGALASVTLQEALLLVANHFCNYERQSALVAEVTRLHITLCTTDRKFKINSNEYEGDLYYYLLRHLKLYRLVVNCTDTKI